MAAAREIGIDPVSAFVLGALAALVFATAVGLVALRTTGVSFMIVALTGAIVGESANAAGYSRRDTDAPTAYNTQANPHYGFGPRVRVQPTDVISGDRMIGRDPDPFIRGQILRNYR